MAALDELANRAQQRAIRARRHADQARDQALSDAAHGDHEAERVHLREAEAHAGAAHLIEQTAALYRKRARRLARG